MVRWPKGATMAVGVPLAFRSMVVTLPSPSVTVDQRPAAVVGELIANSSGEGMQGTQMAARIVKDIDLAAVLGGDDIVAD